ncbi:CaiB/BaiF CoA transferase family protein [Pseudonocardia sp. H11422]|uniref:CaiB/BaiF CoA transferase family protein n=1 Tax=Pseudonocardia sp. H11422 TaxID=2835866 RepID=UPI001BDBEA8B|nr:CoA transferase [Pseudonocardia sp. H11422]
MTTADRPLSGIRVIEAGTLIAGPFCGQILGDFGAEVIKLEEPGVGDPLREWGKDPERDLSLSWPIIARNKKSVTCNLRTPQGQDLVRRLAERSDVLVENFRPGTLERWGLGFDELSQINPRIILVRVSGFGQNGPYASRAGFGVIGEAMGGIRYVTGEPDRAPSRIGISLGDSLAGTFAALGTAMALQARERTGRGQVVDCAIYEAVLALMEALLPEWTVSGKRRERSGSILPGIAPSNAYPTADGSDVLIGANRDTVFTRFCRAIGQPELADDPRFATHQARGANQEELDILISHWTGKRDCEDVLACMHEAGVPAGRIYRAQDMLCDPHFAAREAIVRITDPRLGEIPMQNVAPKLSRTPGAVSWPGPELGRHNDEIYRDLLGLGDAELQTLRADGVL